MCLKRVFACTLLAASALVFVSRARAACSGPIDNIVCDGTTTYTGIIAVGSDNITNNGTLTDPSFTNFATGDGTITNNGSAAGLGNAPLGNGTVTNNGSSGIIANVPLGNGTVTNNGSATGLGNASIGDGTVTNNGTTGAIVNLSLTGTANTNINGTVTGDVVNGGMGANNQVTLGDGAVVSGTIYNVGVNGTLAFSMTVDASAIDKIAAQIAQANPSGGTITINGQTYTWSSFDQLKNLLKTAAGHFLHYGDGRINDKDAMETMAAYCAAGGGLTIWAINAQSQGTPVLSVSKQQITDALAKATSSGKNVEIAEAQGRQVWALKSNELSLHDARGIVYDYVFPANRCG